MTSGEKYAAAQKAWIEMTGLKVGSQVKITHKAKSYDKGWGDSWTWTMDEIFDKNPYTIHTVRSIATNKISLDSWNWPFYVLEVVFNPKDMPDPIEISSSYKAEFKAGGDIEVGCQKIPYDTLKKIFDTATEVKDAE